MPWVAPPLIWLVAVSGLRMRPESCTATYLRTPTRPSSASTSTSTKCAPNALRTFPSDVGFGDAEAINAFSPFGNPFSVIWRLRSRAASMTAYPVMSVVRLPDSPTENGQRSVSPQTISIFDNGTPSSSAAIMLIVVLAPAPMSVTPTNTVYRPLESSRSTALLWPRGDRRAMKDMPEPFPLEGLCAAADAILKGIVRVGCLVVRLSRHVLHDELYRIHFHLVGDVVHHRLDAEEALRKLGRAVISRNRPVGRNWINRALDVGALIELDPTDSSRILAVRTHAAIAAQLKCL